MVLSTQSATSGRYLDIAEDPRLKVYLGSETTKEWLRVLVSGHALMSVASKVPVPSRFVEDFVKTAADCIFEWPHSIHMPATDLKVIAGKR
jgi:hypothetical protein